MRLISKNLKLRDSLHCTIYAINARSLNFSICSLSEIDFKLLEMRTLSPRLILTTSPTLSLHTIAQISVCNRRDSPLLLNRANIYTDLLAQS